LSLPAGARHSLCAEEEVVYAVHENVDGRGGAGEEGVPVPAVVLRIQQQVRRDDGHARHDDREDEEDGEHEAVHVVELVVPEGGEDEVGLDEDGAEGQQAREEAHHLQKADGRTNGRAEQG